MTWLEIFKGLLITDQYGPVAQLVLEHVPDKDGVSSSNLLGPTINIKSM